MATTKSASPRERLLAAANELFYAEGIHTVGIDRVLETAGVAKASLYNTFGSKDELVRAYLEARAEKRQRRIAERIATLKTPEQKILGVYELHGEIASEPGYRGCPFVNASAEGDRDKVEGICAATRSWTRDLFTGLAREHGARNADDVGRQLAMLYDGLVVGAAMDRDPARIKTRVKDAKKLAGMVLATATR